MTLAELRAHTERHAPATIIRMTRAEFDAQLDRAPGATVAYPLHRGRVGYPTLPPPCRCPIPIDDDGTCIRCGRNTTP